eukprot:Ihof_evm35s1 gene=Ihof_evmTU35s1
MFYAQYILAKNGPLALVWQAAHWDLKNKKVVNDTNIEDKVQHIVAPSVPIALRTSGHLLVGVVKIYSKKAFYLANDCNDALTKIKVAFKPGNVEMENNAVAQPHHLTNTHFDFDSAFDLTRDEIVFDLNMQSSARTIVGRLDQITLDIAPEVDISMMDLLEEPINMGDGNDLELEMPRDANHGDLSFHPEVENLDISLLSAKKGDKSMTDEDLLILEPETSHLGANTHDMGDEGVNGALGEAFDLDAINFDGLDLDMATTEAPEAANMTGVEDAEIPRDAGVSGEEMVDRVTGLVQPEMVVEEGQKDVTLEVEAEAIPQATDAPIPQSPRRRMMMVDDEEEVEDLVAMPMPDPITFSMRQAKRRKTKLIVDSEITIAGDAMRGQLSDTNDLCTQAAVAPRTRHEMREKANNRNVADLFSQPVYRNLPTQLRSLVTRNMVAHLPNLPLRDFDESLKEKQQAAGGNTTLEDISLHDTLHDTLHDHDDLGAMPLVEEADNVSLELGADEEERTNEDANKRLADGPDMGTPKRQRLDTEEGIVLDLSPIQGQVPDVADLPEINPILEPVLTDKEAGVKVDGEVHMAPHSLNIDFDFAVGQLQEEEGEAAEQFSELKNKRTLKMIKSLKSAFDESETLSFGAMLKGHNRQTAAACLFEILALKTRSYIE